MNKSKYIWVVIGLAVLAGLFMWPKLNDPNKDVKKAWATANVNCLPSHQNASLHIHQQLEILVDGQAEILPAEIGIVRGCMAELHTHDASGTIHLESVTAGKKFKLGDFFAVWRKPYEREGYKVAMTV